MEEKGIDLSQNPEASFAEGLEFGYSMNAHICHAQTNKMDLKSDIHLGRGSFRTEAF